ncbi:MAG: acyltransferase, partial [Thermoguttaceae bacterium]
MMSRTPTRMTGADGVRALACLGIFMHHVAGRLGIVDVGAATLLLDLSSFGVCIFFVLSGILLSAPFWRAYYAQELLPCLSKYWGRRLARIVPAYYVCLAIVAFYSHDTSVTALRRFFSGLTFTNSFLPETFFPVEFDGPLWTVGVEMTSYLLLPVWMEGLFLTRRILPAPLSCVLSVVILLVIQKLLFVIYEPGVTSPVMTGLPHMAAVWLPRRNPVALFLHFLAGVFVASVLVRHPNRAVTHGVDRGIARAFNLYDVLAVMLLVGMLYDLYLETWLPTSRPFSASLAYCCHFPWMDYHWPLFPILAASLLVALARSKR